VHDAGHDELPKREHQGDLQDHDGK